MYFLYISQWLLLGNFVQKVFETNLNFRYQREKNQKKTKDTIIMSNSKLNRTISILLSKLWSHFDDNMKFLHKHNGWYWEFLSEKYFYFFRFITRWYLKLRFVSKTFWTKIPKSNHCDKETPVKMKRNVCKIDID